MRDVDIVRDEASSPFFDASAEGRLALLRCRNCGTWMAPFLFWRASARLCTQCRGSDLVWEAASANAVLVSWTLIHDRHESGSDVEHLVGLLELAEGPWMSVAIEAPADTLTVGRSFTIGFRRIGSEHVPVGFPANEPLA
jgi:uncharacterized OB-fold protein